MSHPFVMKARPQVVTVTTSPDQPATKPNIAEEYAKEVAAKTRTGKAWLVDCPGSIVRYSAEREQNSLHTVEHDHREDCRLPVNVARDDRQARKRPPPRVVRRKLFFCRIDAT